MSAMTDRFEITELLHRHQIAIDLRDGDGYAELFASDGRFESPFASAEGRRQIKEMTLGLHEAGFTEDKRHLTGPSSVEVDGDEARAFSYTDRLRKIDGEWKIVQPPPRDRWQRAQRVMRLRYGAHSPMPVAALGPYSTKRVSWTNPRSGGGRRPIHAAPTHPRSSSGSRRKLFALRCNGRGSCLHRDPVPLAHLLLMVRKRA